MRASVNKALDFLDKCAQQSTFWHLQNDFGLDANEIFRRPTEFIISVRAIFGAGSNIIEQKMAKQIYFDFKINSSTITNFSDAIS